MSGSEKSLKAIQEELSELVRRELLEVFQLQQIEEKLRALVEKTEASDSGPLDRPPTV